MDGSHPHCTVIGHGHNVCVPLNFLCWSIHAPFSMMVLGGGAFGTRQGHEGGVLRNGISALVRWGRTQFASPTQLSGPYTETECEGTRRNLLWLMVVIIQVYTVTKSLKIQWAPGNTCALAYSIMCVIHQEKTFKQHQPACHGIWHKTGKENKKGQPSHRTGHIANSRKSGSRTSEASVLVSLYIWRWYFLSVLANIGMVDLFHFSHSHRCVEIAHCGFICKVCTGVTSLIPD